MTHREHHSVQKVFIFLLMGLFAVLCLMLIALGTQAYRGAVERSTRTNETRVANNYVRSLLRSEEKADVIGVEDQNGMPVLSMLLSYEDEDSGAQEFYVRRVYCRDGYLMESYSSLGRDFNPEDGEIICAMQSFTPVMDANGIRLQLVNSRGEAQTLWVALRAGWR